jgi:hypothetical protein
MARMYKTPRSWKILTTILAARELDEKTFEF